MQADILNRPTPVLIIAIVAIAGAGAIATTVGAFVPDEEASIILQTAGLTMLALGVAGFFYVLRLLWLQRNPNDQVNADA